jgi:PA14 domain-containing protein/putative Ig domain-containing protein
MSSIPRSFHRTAIAVRACALAVALLVIVAANAVARPITLAWDASADASVTGYMVSYGTASGIYMTTVDVGNLLSWQVDLPGSQYYFAVRAYDAAGRLSDYSLEVGDAAGVALRNPGAQADEVGRVVFLQLFAIGPVVSYDATGLPDGLTLNPASGIINGTVRSKAGAHVVTVRAIDPGNNVSSVQFIWRIGANRAPTLTNPGNQTSVEATAITLAVAATDPDGGTLTYSASGLPTGLSINPLTGFISGTVAYGAKTMNTVTVSVSDGLLSASTSFLWRISRRGIATGLFATYFDNVGFTGATVTRIDPTIDFAWGAGSPDPAIGPDTFSVRWTGQVEAQFTETYTFYTQSDDGVRLWVNGRQLVNNWTNHRATENSGTIALTAGQRYDIRMDFYENTGSATARLSWSSASTPKAIVPTARLFPDEAPATIRINFQTPSAAVSPGYLKDAGLVYGNRGNGQSYGWNADNTAQMRDRNAANSPDQRYDTLAYMQRPGNPDASWELAVPNGSYSVRIVAGDPSYFDSAFAIAAEGVLVVSGTTTSANRWLDGTATVTVADGRLTIRNATGASSNKICFVEVTAR